MTLHLHNPPAPGEGNRMTTAFNLMHEFRHRRFPEPDGTDLAHLAAIARRDPDRSFVPGPCLQRLERAGLIASRQDPRRGKEVVVTGEGLAAIGSRPIPNERAAVAERA